MFNFNDYDKPARVLNCEFYMSKPDEWYIRDKALQNFKRIAQDYAPDGFDVFLLKDGTVLYALRSRVLTWHGRNARKSIKTNLIDKVYACHEQVVLAPEDYAKGMEGIYRGVNSRAWKNGVSL